MSILANFVRTSPLARPLRLARLRRIARTYGHEDWPKLLREDWTAWREARQRASGGQRILLATSMGGHFSITAIDRLLAIALSLRGADVTMGLCDGALSACQMCEANLFPNHERFVRLGPNPDLCSYCYGPAADANRALDIPTAPYGVELSDDDRRMAAEIAANTPLHAIEQLRWQDVPVGEHAFAGALRFFARGQIDNKANSEAILRRYLAGAMQMAIVADRLMGRFQPEIVVVHHGIYVPQGIIAAVARRHHARVVTWNPAYRKHCFLFSHGDTYHHTMMDEPLSSWADRPLTTEEATLIDEYLRSRWEGDNDWIRFHEDPDYTLTADLSKLGLDPVKPVVIALTNVFWDAQLHYPRNAFASQRDWLIQTIAWFADHPELQLVVRIHPAEINGEPASRQFAADEIAAVFPQLPPNVLVLPPSSSASTYHLAQQSDCAIIYATKTGVELTSIGIPVIAAGEAWIRNKGITYDVTSADHYRQLLEQLPFRRRLAPDVVERARRYAFHFFFRRMIPIEFVEASNRARRFSTRIARLSDLDRGASIGLDVICDGIMTGSPFHMPEAAATAIARRQGV